jgi:hypothetical protein
MPVEMSGSTVTQQGDPALSEGLTAAGGRRFPNGLTALTGGFGYPPSDKSVRSKEEYEI